MGLALLLNLGFCFRILIDVYKRQDFQYVDLSSKIPANLWRTIGDKTYYYQNYVMQKDNWIQDQSRWYYIDSDGQAYKGWLEQDLSLIHI